MKTTILLLAVFLAGCATLPKTTLETDVRVGPAVVDEAFAVGPMPSRARLLGSPGTYSGLFTADGFIATNGGFTSRNANYNFTIGTAGNAFVNFSSADNIWHNSFGTWAFEATLNDVIFHRVPTFTDGIRMNGLLTFSSAVPTIGSGFGTSPSVTAGKASAFRINVGTGGVATSGVISFPVAATTGWNCMCNTITTHSATVHVCKQTADTTTSVTIGNFNTAGAAAAWVASNIVAVNCVAY